MSSEDEASAQITTALGDVALRDSSLHSPVTPAQPPSSTRAFAIPELLENILLQLRSCGSKDHWSNGIADMFVAQRVSKYWQEVIANSISLKRAMLLEHNETAQQATPFGLEYLLDPGCRALQVHPALPCIMPLENKADLPGMETPFKHVMLKMTRVECKDKVLRFFCDNHNDGCFDLPDEEQVELARPSKKLFRAESSWKKMKLCCKDIQLLVDVDIGAVIPTEVSGEHEVEWFYPIALFFKGHETIGDLLRELLQIKKRTRATHRFQRKELHRAERIMEQGYFAWRDGAGADNVKVRNAWRLIEEHRPGCECQRTNGCCSFWAAVLLEHTDGGYGFDLLQKLFEGHAAHRHNLEKRRSDGNCLT